MSSGEPPLFHDDDLSAEEVRQMRRRAVKRRVLFIGVPAALLLIAVVGVSIPLLKNWRARQFASRAEELAAAGSLQDAMNNASSAMQMRPDLPEVQRAYAKALLAAGQPQALPILQALASGPKATTDDRLLLADAAVRTGQTAAAEAEATRLLSDNLRVGEAKFVLARVRLAQNRQAEAIKLLAESLEQGGGAKPAVLLAQLQLAGQTPEAIDSALRLLRPLATQKNQEGLEALLVLVNSPALTRDEGADWIEALRSHPLASDEQKLMAASAEMRRTPAASHEVVLRTVEAYHGGTTDQRVQLGRWLNQNREYAEVLRVIPLDDARTRNDLFLIWLDAMAGGNNWKAIREVLAGSNLPLQQPLILLFRGRAARETGDPEGASGFYQRAVIEAAPTPEVMWYVINYLQRIGEEQVLERELKRLTDNPSTARQAFQALVPLVQKRQDAEEIFQLYDRMRGRLPAEPIVQNDHRYFAALTGRRPDVAGAREMVAAEPEMLAYRITLALALLKSAQPSEALAVFNGVTLDPAQIQPYQRAVLAAVLGANGRTDEARQLARSVPGDAVTVEEIALIAPWRDDG